MTNRTIPTALGPVRAEDLGMTLMHEHLLINQMREQRRTGLVNDVEQLIRAVKAYAAVGGRTIVDLTVTELARGAAPKPGAPRTTDRHTRPASNIDAVARVAKETGVQVILGTGHYRDPYLDHAWFDEHSADEIAELMIQDLTVGFPGTDGVRAGIIGEIGSNLWYLSAAEERSFRAAARAHHATGATITTHAARWPVGTTQLNLLCDEERVPPDRVIIGHVDTVRCPLEYAISLARSGAWVELDNLRSPRESDLSAVAELVNAFDRAGLIGRLLLSHDLCTTADWPDGGGVGLTHIPTTVRDFLLNAGLDADTFDQLMVENPRTALIGQASP